MDSVRGNPIIGGLLYFMVPIMIFIFTMIYKYVIHSATSASRGRHGTKSKSSESIPDAKERAKLFHERKNALIEKARAMYLKKRSDATDPVE